MIDLAMRFRDMDMIAPSRRVNQNPNCLAVCGYPDELSPKNQDFAGRGARLDFDEGTRQG